MLSRDKNPKTRFKTSIKSSDELQNCVKKIPINCYYKIESFEFSRETRTFFLSQISSTGNNCSKLKPFIITITSLFIDYCRDLESIFRFSKYYSPSSGLELSFMEMLFFVECTKFQFFYMLTLISFSDNFLISEKKIKILELSKRD